MKQEILTAAIAIIHNKQDADFWLIKYAAMLQENTPGLAPYLAYLVASALKYHPSSQNLAIKTIRTYRDKPLLADAIISGLHDKERSFLAFYTQSVKDTSDFFAKRLNKVIKN